MNLLLIGDEQDTLTPAVEAPLDHAPVLSWREESGASAPLTALERKRVEAFLRRAAQSEAAQERVVLLGFVLAQLVDVPPDDVSTLVGVKPKMLERLIHGDEQVPGKRAKKLEQVAELLENLNGVLGREATGRWLRTEIPRLGHKTPLDLISRGKIDRVLALTRSYVDPSFS